MGEQRAHTHTKIETVRTYIINHSWCSRIQINRSLKVWCKFWQNKNVLNIIKPRQRRGSPYKTQNFGVQGLNKRRHAPPTETHLFLVDFAVISPVAPMVSSINHPIELREPPVALLSPNLVRRNKVWSLPPRKKKGVSSFLWNLNSSAPSGVVFKIFLGGMLLRVNCCLRCLTISMIFVLLKCLTDVDEATLLHLTPFTTPVW